MRVSASFQIISRPVSVRFKVRVRVRTPRRVSVRVSTPSRVGQKFEKISKGDVVFEASCLQGVYRFGCCMQVFFHKSLVTLITYRVDQLNHYLAYFASTFEGFLAVTSRLRRCPIRSLTVKHL